MSRSSKSFGLPGSWKWPGYAAMGRNMWNTRKDAAMFPPKVWGFGWSFNFGYVRIKSKPLWKRVIAFVLGVVFLLAMIYALVCLVMLVLLFLFTKKTEVLTVTLQ